MMSLDNDIFKTYDCIECVKSKLRSSGVLEQLLFKYISTKDCDAEKKLEIDDSHTVHFVLHRILLQQLTLKHLCFSVGF